jgi:hypothetical protein
MIKLKLYWEFYKSVILINLTLIYVSLKYNYETIFVNLCFFAIPIIFIYKRYFRENEYYFYYNMNISKLNLFTFCFIVNFFIATAILIIFKYYEL